MGNDNIIYKFLNAWHWDKHLEMFCLNYIMDNKKSQFDTSCLNETLTVFAPKL